MLWVYLRMDQHGNCKFVQAKLGANGECKNNTYFSLYSNDNFKWVSSGRDAVFAVNANGNLYSLENMSFDDSGNMQQSELLYLCGNTNSVSIHRGIAWMVNTDNSLRKYEVESETRKQRQIGLVDYRALKRSAFCKTTCFKNNYHWF